MDKFDFTSHDVEADRQEWLGVWKQTVERHSGGAEIPSFLSFFNEEEIRIVHDLGRRLHLVPGHSLYYEGQVANSFGLVLDGLLEASVQDDNGEPQIVGRIRAADTFGEMPLIVDGSIGGGKREATLTSVEKSTLVVISYTKFAQMFESLSPARKKALRTELTKMAAKLVFPMLGKPESSRFGLPPKKRGYSKAKDDDGMSVGETLQTGIGKVVLDTSPVTLLGMGTLLECVHRMKRNDFAVQNRAQQIVGDEVQVPHTAVFEDGELKAWYWGTCTALKRKSKEKLQIWHLIDEFSKGARPGQHGQNDLVATLICTRPGKKLGSEFVQTRFLDRRRLQMVVSGAGTNRLTGVVQKYTRQNPYRTGAREEDEREYVVACTWANHSYTTDWVPEQSMECFAQGHRPAYLQGGRRIRSRMVMKFLSFVPGTISQIGDHMTVSSPLKQRTLEQMMTPMLGTKDRNRFKDDDEHESLEGKIVGRDIREVTKFACQQISATVVQIANEVESARRKAEEDARNHESTHDCEFRNLETMCCYFKVRKSGGPPLLMHCSVAMTHPAVKKPISQRAKDEIVQPQQSTFAYYASWGSGQSMLSAIGDRATTMDFTEFLRMLAEVELLYTHISVTEASRVFKRVCAVGNAEDGQLSFSNYLQTMRLVGHLLSLPVPQHEQDDIVRSDAGSAAGNDAVGVFKKVSSSASQTSKVSKTRSSAMQATSMAAQRRAKAPFGAGPGIGIDAKPWGAASSNPGALSPDKVKATLVKRSRKERNIVRLQSEAGVAISDKGSAAGDSFGDEDTEARQLMQVRRQRDLVRERLGRLFAANIIFEQRIEDVEQRAAVREQKHEQVTRARHEELSRRLEAAQKARTHKIRTLEEKREATRQQREEEAKQNWSKIEEVTNRVASEKREHARHLADTMEQRRQARLEQLKNMREESERREEEIKKKVRMLDDHRRMVSLKRGQVRDNMNKVKDRVAREHEVVAELYADYMRTGALVKPTGLVDLDGDALTAVLEVAASKSKLSRGNVPTETLLPRVLGNSPTKTGHSPMRPRSDSAPP